MAVNARGVLLGSCFSLFSFSRLGRRCESLEFIFKETVHHDVTELLVEEISIDGMCGVY
ncbi:MAG: mycofactocin precursor [Betaproteobacteria bacterium]|nr:mycofactocin precursor [Betaproteobacteria bacterium]